MIKREETLGKFNMLSNDTNGKDEFDFLTQSKTEQSLEQNNFNLLLRQEEAKKQAELWEGKDIIPFGFNVLVRFEDENPYHSKIDIESGFVTDTGGLFKNPDTGEEDHLEQGIMYGTIIKVGPDVKYLKAGDGIYLSAVRCLPIQFKGESYKLINEGHVLCIINRSEELTERIKTYEQRKR